MLLHLPVLPVQQLLGADLLQHQPDLPLPQLMLLQVQHLHLDSSFLKIALRLLGVEVLLSEIDLDHLPHSLPFRMSLPRRGRYRQFLRSVIREAMRSV